MRKLFTVFEYTWYPLAPVTAVQVTRIRSVRFVVAPTPVGAAGMAVAPDVELVSSADFEPWPVQFERAASDFASADGPLSIAEDLPVQPFELTLRIPATWPDEIYQRAVNVILSRFILRYRAFQAYGQHL